MKKAKTDTGLIKKAPDARARTSKKTGEKAPECEEDESKECEDDRSKGRQNHRSEETTETGRQGSPFPFS